MTTENKNNIVNGIDCCNSEALYFSESERFLKSQSDGKRKKKDLLKIAIAKRMQLRNTVTKSTTALAGIKRKLKIYIL